MVKVRFAPSPTGIQHIGGIRTALFNYLFAKANNGEFILRIEDTDQKRIVKGAKEAIIESLSWLGIDPKGEIVSQSGRLDIYKKYANDLLDKRLAYEKDGAIWINVGDDKTFEWTDLVGRKKIVFKGKDVEDFVIIKSDGFPTYHLANVIDDHLMGITHVMRGEEWISSTPKHLYLYESFGWQPPQFAHLPVILGQDKTKLSKRLGAKSALDYKKEGFVKEALLNFMALLGWNPGKDKEQMSLEEMARLFKIDDINSANPVFDTKKLEWLNGVWIRTLNKDKKLRERLEDFYKDDKKIAEILKGDKSFDLVNAASSRMKTLRDFEELVDFEKQIKFTKEEKDTAEVLLQFLEKKLGYEWENDKLLSAIKEFSGKQNVPFATIFFLMTGKKRGIGILELNQIYGRDFFLRNLKN